MHPAAPANYSLALNPRTLQLGGPDGWVDVTAAECQLLQAFARSTGQRMPSAAMLDSVGKPANPLGKRALEVQIVRLRKKLIQAGAPSPVIKAIRGLGYQLCVPLQQISPLSAVDRAEPAGSTRAES